MVVHLKKPENHSWDSRTHRAQPKAEKRPIITKRCNSRTTLACIAPHAPDGLPSSGPRHAAPSTGGTEPAARCDLPMVGKGHKLSAQRPRRAEQIRTHPLRMVPWVAGTQGEQSRRDAGPRLTPGACPVGLIPAQQRRAGQTGAALQGEESPWPCHRAECAWA